MGRRIKFRSSHHTKCGFYFRCVFEQRCVMAMTNMNVYLNILQATYINNNNNYYYYKMMYEYIVYTSYTWFCVTSERRHEKWFGADRYNVTPSSCRLMTNDALGE